jgi:uncharacterized ferritin-like protein (DUF455 family)
MAQRFDPMTVQAWARAYIESTSLEAKLAPPTRPSVWDEHALPLKLCTPGRPPMWLQTARVKKLRKGGAFTQPERRAELVARMFGHELQAAELMAWALLAFPETPRAYKQGLLGVMDDEIRHMNTYAKYLQTLGFSPMDFPARDWFWERIPSVQTPEGFCATMGIGFEGGNLDHASRFVAQFKRARDDEGAAMLETVHEEEIPHVRFAMHWFERFTGGLSFETWRASLPPPLSPWVMKGTPMDHAGRTRAGFAPDFLGELERWTMSGT